VVRLDPGEVGLDGGALVILGDEDAGADRLHGAEVGAVAGDADDDVVTAGDSSGLGDGVDDGMRAVEEPGVDARGGGDGGASRRGAGRSKGDEQQRQAGAQERSGAGEHDLTMW
jgi:hypothetical protein